MKRSFAGVAFERQCDQRENHLERALAWFPNEATSSTGVLGPRESLTAGVTYLDELGQNAAGVSRTDDADAHVGLPSPGVVFPDGRPVLSTG